MRRIHPQNPSINLVLAAFATIAVALSPSESRATDGTWNSNVNNNWSAAAAWSGSNIATGAGSVADFSQFNLTGSITVTLDSARTIGFLNIGDTNNTNSYTIGNNTANTLTFDGNGVDAAINVSAGSIGDSITKSPVAIAGNGILDFTNSSAVNFTISSVISGASSVINVLGGGLTLSGVNTFAGGVNVKAGQLLVSTATGTAGTGAITVGDSSGSANAALYVSSATVSNNITVQAGSTGTATIGSTLFSTAGTFGGNITANKTLNLNGATNTVTFSGQISGNAGVNVTNSMYAVSSTGQQFGTVDSPLNGGQVVVSSSNTYTGDTQVLSGNLVLKGEGVVDSRAGASANPILLGDTTGALSAGLFINDVTTTVTLGKAVTVQAGSGGLAYLGSVTGNNHTPIFNSNITLYKSVDLSSLNGTTDTFNGVFSSGTGALGGMSLIKTGDRALSTVTITGKNTYDGGTLVGSGILSVTGTGTLGTGNVFVEGGILRVSGTTAIAVGKTIAVGPNGMVGFNFSNITQSQLQSIIAPGSSGAFAIGLGTGATANFDLSKIGNGMMYFAGDAANVTYSGTSLGANSDGNYRLGFGFTLNGGGLALANGVLVDSSGGSAQVIIGGAQGATNPYAAGNFTNQLQTNGNVTLNGTNTYSGGTVVNSTSKLIGQALVSGSPFGSTTGSMTLHNSTVQLSNSGTTATSATVGTLNFDGNSAIVVGGATGGSNTFNIGQLTRNQQGTLSISPTGTGAALGSTVFLKTTGSTPSLISTNGGANQMVAPYYFDASGDFLNYDPTNGFVIATPTATTGAAAITTGTDNYVQTSGSLTIGTSGTVAALSLKGNLSATATGVTVKITSGGLSNAGASTVTIGGAGSAAVNLDFGTAEAVISGAQAITITNTVAGSGGLTKSGAGTLALNGSNTFTGTVTVNQGILQVATDSSLGASTNGILLNGGALENSTTSVMNFGASRTLTVGNNGATLVSLVFGNVTPNWTIAGPVTGTGAYLALNTAAKFAATLDNRNALISFTNTANDFVAPIYVTGRLSLAFSDDRQLGNSANTVSLIGGDAALQYTGTTDASTSRGIIFADQGGAVDVSTSGVTLTSSGPVSGSGMFYKNGFGTLALTGSSSFTGNTIVNAGALNISNSNALGANSAVVTGSTGISGGAVYVQSGATLGVSNNISVGDKTIYASGSGVGGNGAIRNISGSNSLAGHVVFQGATTIGADAGTVVLSGGLIGSTPLTKVGAGTLSLTGNSTGFTGTTEVQGGTLNVGSDAAHGAIGSSVVTLDAGTTLTGFGSVGGVTASSSATVAPGNNSTGNKAGILTVNGAFNLNSGAHLTLDVNGSTAGGAISGYDQIAANSITLAGDASFSFTGYTPASGDVLYIILNNGGSAVSGAFSNFAEGATVATIGGYNLKLTYQANYLGTTNDVALIAVAVPEPETWALLTGGIGLLVFRRRMGRKAAK